MAFANTVCIYNTANFGLPLIHLVFNNPFAMSIQIIIMMAQIFLTNTIGIFNASIGKSDIREAIANVLKIPIIYSILIAIILKPFQIEIWQPVWYTLDLLAQGLIPLALFTLGVQLANSKMDFRSGRVYLSNFVRLIIGPLLAYLLVLISGLDGIAARVFIIAATAPTAVTPVLLAIEFDNEPEFTSRTVFSSTILSAFVISLVIYVTGYLF